MQLQTANRKGLTWPCNYIFLSQLSYLYIQSLYHIDYNFSKVWDEVLWGHWKQKWWVYWIMGLIWFQAATMHSNGMWLSFFTWLRTSPPSPTPGHVHTLDLALNIPALEERTNFITCVRENQIKHQAISNSTSYCWICILHIQLLLLGAWEEFYAALDTRTGMWCRLVPCKLNLPTVLSWHIFLF